MGLLAFIVGVAVALLALAGLVVLFQYNRMVSLRNRVDESWGNIEAELQRRHDLVPNLVAAVQGATKHERAVVEAVTKARAAAMAAPTDAGAATRLVAGLQRLLAVAEAYPKLQASANFLQLQEELAITEDRLAAARRFYNGNVRDYLDQIRQLPGRWIAPLGPFLEMPYYEVPALDVRHVPKVAA